jgi:hypothetical protein
MITSMSNQLGEVSFCIILTIWAPSSHQLMSAQIMDHFSGFETQIINATNAQQK